MGEKVCARRGNLMRCIAVISLLVATMSAQNAPSTNKRRHLDIPAISREARGAVVSIVMADKSGQPIAQGSGFIVSRDGQIVTNYHVIKTGASAVVKLPDGSFFNVDGVLAFDKKRDIALIKAHGNNFKTVALGDSNQLQIGEEVVEQIPGGPAVHVLLEVAWAVHRGRALRGGLVGKSFAAKCQPMFLGNI